MNMSSQRHKTKALFGRQPKGLIYFDFVISFLYNFDSDCLNNVFACYGQKKIFG